MDNMDVIFISIFSAQPVFWSLPSTFLKGASAAAGFAVINSVGNLGGFFGPGLVGMAKDMTGNFESGLYVLAGLALFALFLTVVFVSDPDEVARQKASAELALPKP